MSASDLPMTDLLVRLRMLANDALALWELPDGATARLLNVSENSTFLVEAAAGFRAILRVHRQGYHTRRAIRSELAWIAALERAGTVSVPGILPGRDGDAIQQAEAPGLDGARDLVLFHFIDGVPPDRTGDPVARFRELGAIAARMHLHAIGWPRPPWFERMTWDTERIFGPDATWGDWRAAPGVTPAIRAMLERVEARIRSRLAGFGRGGDRFGLIHADMRLANLLCDATGTHLIDFDDCGFGWFLYDFAAAISFIEDDPRVPALKRAWLAGYTSTRPLGDADFAEIDTFVMLRRMALLAWIGSHIEAPEPQALAPDFAAGTTRLGQAWLDAQSG